MTDEEVINIMIKKIEQLEAKRENIENADSNKRPIVTAIINDLNEVLGNENQ